KQHGHSVQTMLEVYAAWTEGTKEADIEAIKHAMQGSPQLAVRTQRVAEGAREGMPIDPPKAPEFGSRLAVGKSRNRVGVCSNRRKTWRRERDSNPRRAFDPYTLSRGAPSTTRPSLRLGGKAYTSHILTSRANHLRPRNGPP